VLEQLGVVVSARQLNKMVAGFGANEDGLVAGPAPQGRLRALAFPVVNLFFVAFLYGRAGRLAAKNGGFWPRRAVDDFVREQSKKAPTQVGRAHPPPGCRGMWAPT
jgi:hypothetical protein